jgi:hypothetical protein
MPTRPLSGAFDRYLKALGRAGGVDLPRDGTGRLRREVQEAKRRMLEQIDAAERRVLAALTGPPRRCRRRRAGSSSPSTGATRRPGHCAWPGASRRGAARNWSC